MPYCIDQIFGSELPLELETLIDLYDATRSPLWLDMFRMALARLPDFQFSDPDSPLFGSVLEGWSLTRDIPLPTVQGNLLFTNRVPMVMIKYLELLKSEIQNYDP